jgi:predicted alpha/beta hydrolase
MGYDSCHTASHRVLASDGRELPVNVFEPAQAPTGVALVVPAMATPASYYQAFATWLSEQRLRAITFDYRDTDSPRAMRASQIDVDRWAADLDAILSSASADGLPVIWIGHSMGGQLLALTDHTKLDRVVTVAAGNGYWRYNATRVRWATPVLWWVVAPLTMKLFGYYAGSKIGVLGDVPSGVMRQWTRWCRHPHYLEADHPDRAQRFAAVTVPILSLSFTDDELLAKESIDSIHRWFTGTVVHRRHLSPSDLGVRRMRHHGFFRSRHADLWDRLLLPFLRADQPSVPPKATAAAVDQ